MWSKALEPVYTEKKCSNGTELKNIYMIDRDGDLQNPTVIFL